MRNWKKPTLVATTAALAVVLAACAGQGQSAPADGGVQADAAAQPAGAVIQTYNYSWEENQAEYPNQVRTFMRGITDFEGWDSKPHGHAALYKKTFYETYGFGTNEAGGSPNIDTFGTSCIACKSTTGTELYNELGIDAFQNDWTTYAGVDGEKVDWYDCGLCHKDGEPGGALEPGGMAAAAFGASLFEQVSDEEAVCGQCHNYIGAVYTRGGLMDKMQSGEVDPASVNPWRYGMDPESLMKAALEDGYEMMVNPNTGIANFQANHPEVEIFQGSTHKELGLTCVSCHGVTMVGDDGEEFTSHGFSESPLQNEEALEYCLTCHTAQGVKSTDEMKDFVAAAQKKMADAEAAFEERQKELQGMIVAAKDDPSVDASKLEQAKENFTKASWIVRYADGGGDFKGQKIAHNPEGEIDCVERATVLVEEGISLLS